MSLQLEHQGYIERSSPRSTMQLHVDQQRMRIAFTFWEKVWGFHGSFDIHLTHVKELKTGLPSTGWMDFKMLGAFIPGVMKTGTYFSKRGKEFWYVTRGNKKYLTIELENERYKRVVLSLPMGSSIPNAMLQIR